MNQSVSQSINSSPLQWRKGGSVRRSEGWKSPLGFRAKTSRGRHKVQKLMIYVRYTRAVIRLKYFSRVIVAEIVD